MTPHVVRYACLDIGLTAVGCTCGFKCTTQNPDEEIVKHLSLASFTPPADPSPVDDWVMHFYPYGGESPLSCPASDGSSDYVTANVKNVTCKDCRALIAAAAAREPIPTRTSPKIVRIARAVRTPSADVPELSIFAIHPPPRFARADWFAEARAFYAVQAAELADALFATLPGGTIDALLVEMLRRKSSVLSVSAMRAGGAGELP